MEEILPILKKATESITKLQKSHRATKRCIEATERALARIAEKMESTIVNIDKTGQDAVHNSIKLVWPTLSHFKLSY